ncbi:CN hydrolase domain containing protein, partial [Asbolus verrucosus]
DVDIIVFTEYGLTTLVDNPEGYAIEFTNDNPILKKLSDLASQHAIYIVVNLLEQVKENTKIKYYNTNLVYNRQGQIIAKYRKINLFNEPNLTAGNEMVTFSTDFGVTFGVMTCFDILYHNPSRTLLDNSDVEDIVYPVAWFSTMPFYTALTVQHGYFASNKVTLLAANYGEPQRGHGGSGIYVAKGNIAHIDINGAAGNTLIVHDIQKSKRKANRKNCVTTTSFGRHVSNKPADISDYLTYRDFKAADYQFQDVDLTRGEVSTEICHGQICCSFNITAEQPPNTKEVYKLMAYEGKVIFDRSYVYIRVCSLLACQNETRDSCGARINGTTKFTKISVDGRVPKDGTTFYTPITLNYGL